MKPHTWIEALAQEESGAASVEYSILVSGIAAGIIAVAMSIGAFVFDLFDMAATEMGRFM